jgi:hypothetical protein
MFDPKATRAIIRRHYGKRVGFLPDRETGGYTTSMGLAGPGATLREIDVSISPAVGTLSAAVEQTFTVPGVLATDRCIAVTPTSNPAFGTSAGSFGAPRVSAISIVSVPFVNAGTSAAQPTTSSPVAFWIATARAL